MSLGLCRAHSFASSTHTSACVLTSAQADPYTPPAAPFQSFPSFLKSRNPIPSPSHNSGWLGQAEQCIYSTGQQAKPGLSSPCPSLLKGELMVYFSFVQPNTELILSNSLLSGVIHIQNHLERGPRKGRD